VGSGGVIVGIGYLGHLLILMIILKYLYDILGGCAKQEGNGKSQGFNLGEVGPTVYRGM